jgi:hypothetical protein
VADTREAPSHAAFFPFFAPFLAALWRFRYDSTEAAGGVNKPRHFSRAQIEERLATQRN